MSTSSLVTALLTLGVVIALSCTLPRLRRDHAARSSAVIAWFAILAALHVASAATLRYVLLPPSTRIAAETVEIRTGGVAGSADTPRAERILLLPEAPANADAERVADLASGLRRYPDARRIRVTGAGLVARDRDAAHSVVVEFHPSPPPVGLVELHAPGKAVQGARWRVGGRLEGLPGALVQLIDPAGVAVASANADAAGNFRLLAHPRAAGPAEYSLRIGRAAQQLKPDTIVPVLVTPGDRMRVLLLAGAPGPELKYLRRWMLDTGLDVRSEVTLGAVNRLTAPDSSDRGQRFAGIDLVVLDERAWRALGDAGNRALVEAARAGSGVLLRITGPLDDSDRHKLRLWGFGAGPSPAPQPRATRERADAVASVLTLRPTIPAISAPDTRLFEDPRDGAVTGVYRLEGRGRMGLWWASDSYRLALRGDAAAHGALWSHAFTALARARSAASAPRLDQGLARVGERRFVCDIDEGALVKAPDGQRFTLLRSAAQQPADGTARTGRSGTSENSIRSKCAAFWPRVAGWHQVIAGDVSEPFHVRARDDAPGLFAYEDREATLQLAARAAPSVRPSQTTLSQPRWPWFLAWLAATALMWGVERASIPVARR